MALQRFTHCRPLGPNASIEAVIRAYRTYRRCYRDTLPQFIAHYERLWTRAHQHGVTAYDGIIRLVYLLPEEWQGWAMITARRYVRCQYPAYDLVGDMIGFLGAISTGCYKYHRGPPPTSAASSHTESGRLPPWALLGHWQDDEPSQGVRALTEDEEEPMEEDATDKYVEEEGSTEDNPTKENPEEEGSAEDDPAKEEPEEDDSTGENEGLDEESGEEKPKTEDTEPVEELQPEYSELMETETAPPVPAGSMPEPPSPHVEPCPEIPPQLSDQAFHDGMHACLARCRGLLAELAQVGGALERPESVMMPMVPEELLSSMRTRVQGSTSEDPMWVSSESDSEEEPMKDE
ncbi:hypothetical protein AAHA92_10658 [Salvia divinorum]|uniref:Uncharacterized protein n=1 Tax=Salvia divinorum TaxID=28513 RepID=A0ABD1HWP4_SALDI